MQILKVLNNSLMLALDETGRECILMGKGIGYKKSIGSKIHESEIQKIFVSNDKKMLGNFIQLANTIEDIYFDLAKEIIDYAVQKYQLEVMDSLYLSLADHIAFVVKRFKNGGNSESFNYREVMLHHRTEYEIGKYAVKRINKILNLQLPDIEATAIGLHFINSKMDNPSFQREQNINKLEFNIEKIVQRSIGKTFDEDSFTYSRFLTHLNYFCERVYDNKLFSDENSEDLYQTMAEKMPTEDSIIKDIKYFINREYNIDITSQEKIYLLVYLNRIVSNKD